MQELKSPPPSPPPAGAADEPAAPWRRLLARLRQARLPEGLRLPERVRLKPPPLPPLPRFAPPRPALPQALDLGRLRELARLRLPLPRRRFRVPAVALPWGRLAAGLLLVEAAALTARVRVGLAKPFWYDEQWRAYHVSVTGSAFWRQIRQANAPIAGGWVLLEKGAALLLGNVELALRLPMALGYALAVVLTWLVGRRLLGWPGGLLVAGALAVNGPLFAYVPQLKPYTVEAMAAVGVLALWLWAGDPGRGFVGRLAAYSGIGLLAVLATGVIFVIAPLLVLDLACASLRWRSPLELVRRLLPGAVAGGLALAHLKWFVLAQPGQLGATYWRSQFVPRGSVAQAWHFAVTQVAGWIPEVVTGTLRPSAALGWLLGLALLAGTIWAILVERRLLVLPVALFGALALQYVAAARWLWPFGFVRVNLFLVPLVYLLAGAGIFRPLALLARFARARLRHQHGGNGAGGEPGEDGSGGESRRARAWRLAQGAAAGVLALALATTVVVAGREVVPDGLKQIQLISAQTHQQGWGDGIRELVRLTRQQQVPGSLVVVGGAMGVKGWSYYMWYYTGWEPALRGKPPIPPDRTLLMARPNARAMAAFLAAHRGARQVTVLLMLDSGVNMARSIGEPLRRAGWHLQSDLPASNTGRLLTFTRAGR